MSKEARLEQARRDRQIAIDAVRQKADKEIESLLAEIEAEKKPKLRHGDYGFWRWNRSSHYIIVLNKKDELCYQWEKGLGVKTQLVLDNTEDFVAQGNIFDDLKAMQEDVTASTEDFVINHVDEDLGKQNICMGVAVHKGGFYLRSNGVFHATESELKRIHAFIGRRLATLKRRQK